jgi:mannose-6-phosphate isomerase-like protein (cupin superfamily)
MDATHQTVASVDTIAKRIAAVEKKVKTLLPDLDLSTDGFTDKLHYEIPAYSFINEPFPSIVDESIAEWRHYRELAKVFYMLEGKLELIFNENTLILNEGDTITVPPNVWHEAKSIDEEKMLTTFRKGAFDLFISTTLNHE